MSNESDIRRLIERSTADIRRRFVQALQLIREAHTIEELGRLLDAGRLDDALSMAERAAGAVLGAITASYMEAANLAAAQIAQSAGFISFDQSNQAAVEFMRGSRLSLIQEMRAEQRQMLSRVMAQGIEDGLNPRAQARLFRSSVGLTGYQAQIVQNYRRALESGDLESALGRQLRDARSDRRVASALTGRGRPLSSQEIDRLVDRYRERWIKHRSESIGRTEALRSVHQGSEDMWRQAIASGDIDPDDIERTWRARIDGRERDSHRSMNGQRRRFDEPFVSGNGNRLRYPGDPRAPASETIHCRCVVVVRIRH